MLRITQITKRYKTQTALDSVTLSLELNKTHVLLGSSGSGKSTLLRIILGLITSDGGSTEMDGDTLAGLNSQDRATKFGYMPQDAGLFPHLTSLQNITLAARSLNWSKEKIAQRLSELRQVVALDDGIFDRYPSEISGGQKQRVALLRSLFLDPPVILMDEPFAALDPLVRADIQAEVKSLFQRLKKTVIFITHDIGEADFLSDNIVLLHEGRVVQQGQLKDLIEKPASSFVTKFMNAQRIYTLKSEVK